MRLDQQHQLAIDWLAVLQHEGHEIVPLLLRAGHTNIIGNVFSYCTEGELDKRLREERDPHIRSQLERAKTAVARHGNGHIKLILVEQSETTLNDGRASRGKTR